MDASVRGRKRNASLMEKYKTEYPLYLLFILFISNHS